MIRYSQDYLIPCYDTDASRRLKPVSFMNLAQEAATSHADLLGFGYDELIKSHTAWILSRMHVIFVDPPLWREKVSLKTWHKGLNGLFFLRDFQITDSEDRLRVKATTSWLVLDLESRRLVRDPELMDADGICTDNAVETPCDKVRIPRDVDAEHVMDHTVSYSDVDMNEHANNAMYMHWAMDCIDYELTSSRPVKEMKINFNHETRPGDCVSLYRSVVRRNDSIVCYVEGKVGETSAFCTEIIF